MTDSTEDFESEARITPRLIDALYTEAMILADEARARAPGPGPIPYGRPLLAR